jgi:hypothetical protein
MAFDRNRRAGIVRWGRVLAWIAAWALVVAAGHHLPSWAAIAAAIAVFGAQLLLAPGRAACHLPDAARDGVTKGTPPRGP